jgi:polar amino acid transport system substrate-binding protein
VSGIKYLQNICQTACLLACLLFSTDSLTQASAIAPVTLEKDRPFLEFVSFIEPPYVFDETETRQQGLVRIILAQLMLRAGIDYKVTIMPPKRAELYAQFTPNTCVIPIEKSQEREVFFSWVSPVLISQNGLFQLKSAPPILLNSLEESRPYRIGSYLGSSIGDYLSSFSYKVDLATQNDANLHKLKAERIDLWASDVLSARYLAQQANIPITETRLNFFTSLRAIGCHHEVEPLVLSAMQNALQKMYKTGQMKQILQSFYGMN